MCEIISSKLSMDKCCRETTFSKNIFFVGSMSQNNNITVVEAEEDVVLHCSNTPGNTVIQWIRLNLSQSVTKTTYTDGWEVSQDIPHYHRISITSFPNSTTYDLMIVNVTESDSGIYRCVGGTILQPVVVELIVTSTGFSNVPCQIIL